jgi:hypothetical protein
LNSLVVDDAEPKALVDVALAEIDELPCGAIQRPGLLGSVQLGAPRLAYRIQYV